MKGMGKTTAHTQYEKRIQRKEKRVEIGKDGEQKTTKMSGTVGEEEENEEGQVAGRSWLLSWGSEQQLDARKRKGHKREKAKKWQKRYANELIADNGGWAAWVDMAMWLDG